MKGTRISATRFLLDTTFGNIWANAVQAAPAPCRLTFECSEAGGGKRLRIVVRDNGAGFDKDHQETAFRQAFSTKSTSRGRGLLEMADAVAQLQGSIGIEQVRPGEFRIQIELPTRPA
jgi:sensor histidine kinase regulating citrate/malate metabolism